jgi:TRAP-type mannitol/chloroaromatic compound transport system permease small subunit
MSVAQWYMEKKTNLFKWKAWSVYHTFASINFTLFTIRGFAELLKNIKIPAIMDTQQKKLRLSSHNEHVYQLENIAIIPEKIHDHIH